MLWLPWVCPYSIGPFQSSLPRFATASPLVFVSLFHPQLWPQQLVLLRAFPVASPVIFPVMACPGFSFP